ncbi:hypothetical protein [Ancylobacter terrae]|uniref:hypothetical protein n=1 Tax=Ancylobacter sp. sgz301288 TaxID=3342077 RepID=UPI00385A5E40
MPLLLARLPVLLLALVLLAAAPARAAEPVLDVRDPAALARLEAAGWSFADVLGVPGAATTRALGERSAAFRTLRAAVAGDVAELRADMQAHGRPLYEVTDGNVGRVLDLNWLASPIAAFRLAGIVNRLDRRDFVPEVEGRANCGEVRFIYRLGYDAARAAPAAQGKRLRLSPTRIAASRLPFSLNVVYAVPADADGGCAAAAARWQGAESVAAGNPEALLAGPLAPGRLILRQIELNAQVVRFPSGQEPGFGGQAAYLMRVFAVIGEGAGMALAPKPLENTPDVARLKADAALRAALVDYVKANLPAIDIGVFQLPAPLLATRAISWSTFGSARLANHPFAALLDEADLRGLDLSGLGYVRSPAGLVERLDNASCMGCHQAGGTAGFHFFGLDDAATSDYNRVLQGISPHYAAEQPRRAAYVAALAAGRVPNRFRPLSIAPPARWDGAAAEGRAADCTDCPHCTDRPPDCTDRPPRFEPAPGQMACLEEGGKAAFAAGWTCGAGAVCRVIGANKDLPMAVGQCMPASERGVFAGLACLACLAGAVETGPRAYQDRWKKISQINSFAQKATVSAYTCRPPRIGVPGGLAYRKCGAGDKAFAGIAKGGPMPAEICGLAGGKDFDDCAATNDFGRCYEASVVRGMRPACGAKSFCREDYMCQALPAGLPGAGRIDRDVGFCSPTYFLFQMRLDGHPDPLTGRR